MLVALSQARITSVESTPSLIALKFSTGESCSLVCAHTFAILWVNMKYAPMNSIGNIKRETILYFLFEKFINLYNINDY